MSGPSGAECALPTRCLERGVLFPQESAPEMGRLPGSFGRFGTSPMPNDGPRLSPEEGVGMRRLMFVVAAAAGLYGAARWWRHNRRVGADFVNRIVDPWLEGHGLV